MTAPLLGTDSISNWSFRDNFVSSNVDPGGSFVRGASVLLCAGPPSLAQATMSIDSSPGGAGGANGLSENALAFARPIGLVDNIGIGQSKGLQQIFEIGSERRYFIPGRTANSINMSRVLFDGGSLMKVMYDDYYPAELSYRDPDIEIKTGSPDRKKFVGIKNQPGFDQMFLNLGSEMFNRPIGLLLLVHNLNDEGVAAVYLEYCFIQGHQMNINASSTLFAESIQAQFDKIVPINMNFKRPANTGL